MQGQDVLFSSDYPNFRTPDPLFRLLDQEFNFDIDLAADESNHKLPRWFGPGGCCPDALVANWTDWTAGFLNPAWSRKLRLPIDPWVAKCANAGGCTTVALLPSRTDTVWWHRYVMRADEVRMIPHRVAFEIPPAALEAKNADRLLRGKKPLKKLAGATFPSVVVVWRPRFGVASPITPRFSTWDYR